MDIHLYATNPEPYASWSLHCCLPHSAAEVLLPLYFANSGIKTNIGTLDSGRYWGITLAIIAIACVAKFLPACLCSKLVTGRGWRFCVSMGVLMNTRGLVEVIALNVGLSMVSEANAACHFVQQKQKRHVGTLQCSCLDDATMMLFAWGLHLTTCRIRTEVCLVCVQDIGHKHKVRQICQ